MKRISNPLIGIDQGDTVRFAEFEDGGAMWTGSGPRERRRAVTFRSRFKSAPTVHVSVSLWDVDTASAMRAEITAEQITETGFEIVFRTWLDTRIARIRAGWLAIGELPHDDDWQIS